MRIIKICDYTVIEADGSARSTRHGEDLHGMKAVITNTIYDSFCFKPEAVKKYNLMEGQEIDINDFWRMWVNQ